MTPEVLDTFLAEGTKCLGAAGLDGPSGTEGTDALPDTLWALFGSPAPQPDAPRFGFGRRQRRGPRSERPGTLGDDTDVRLAFAYALGTGFVNAYPHLAWGLEADPKEYGFGLPIVIGFRADYQMAVSTIAEAQVAKARRGRLTREDLAELVEHYREYV